MKQKVFVFGNQDFEPDSLPLLILPELREKNPDIEFIALDPNEEWGVDREITVIDTVEGIEEVAVYDDLSDFVSSPRVTMHDFDALANLRLLKKLGKIDKIKIIGVPPAISEQEAVEKIGAILLST
jgi:cysteine synthase